MIDCLDRMIIIGIRWWVVCRSVVMVVVPVINPDKETVLVWSGTPFHGPSERETRGFNISWHNRFNKYAYD